MSGVIGWIILGAPTTAVILRLSRRNTPPVRGRDKWWEARQ